MHFHFAPRADRWIKPRRRGCNVFNMTVRDFEARLVTAGLVPVER